MCRREQGGNEYGNRRINKLDKRPDIWYMVSYRWKPDLQEQKMQVTLL